MNTASPIQAKQIIVVGGGTSGWLTAAFLSHTLKETCLSPFEITLIESSDIPTIGVGEATTPSLKLTLSSMGIDEYEFMRECDATFKHGIRFAQWVKPPEQPEYYFHPFQAPMRAGLDHAARHWANQSTQNRDAYAQAIGLQQMLAESNYAPKSLSSAAYDGVVPYAYHLDAGKLAIALKKNGIKNGVRHVIGEVCEFDVTEENTFKSITLKSGEIFYPDLLIDCTGFSARFINHDKQNTFINKNHQLFCDTAVVTRVDLASIDEVVPFTKSTAQKNGWIWDINLTKRRGVGHVYSSRYTSEEEAVSTLAKYTGKSLDQIEYRKLAMRIGYHQEQWRGNCVAVGLSGGFLEPLESTGIYLVEMAAWMLSQSITRFLNGNLSSRTRYNFMMNRHFENIVDFIKAHYCLSERRDSAFWIDNCDSSTIPDSLQELLDRWRYDTPNDYDFDTNVICFNSENYQYILYGMTNPTLSDSGNPAISQDYMTKLKAKQNLLLERYRASLPRNHKIMEQILSGQIKPSNVRETNLMASSNYKVR